MSLTYDALTGAGKTTAQTDTYHSRFLKLVPDEQVVEAMEFDTDDPAMQGGMTVTFTPIDRGAGTDVLALHDRTPPGVASADNAGGWQISMGKLADLLAGGR